MSETDDANSNTDSLEDISVESDEKSNIEKASKKDWITLTPDEKVVSARHPAIWPVLNQIVFGGILVVAGVWGAWEFSEVLFLLISIVGIGLAGYAELNRRKSWYVLTTEEVYKKFGIISVSTTHARYDDIQNAELNQSAIENLLDFGDVRLATAGNATTEFRLENIPDPSSFRSNIVRQIDIAQERAYNKSREEAENNSDGN